MLSSHSSEYVAQLVEHWTFNPWVLGSIPNIFNLIKLS